MTTRNGFVYILASRRNGTLYNGVTSDIVSRVHHHKTENADGFSKRYAVKRLVYFEHYDEIALAILREKQIKKWRRAWKIRLIEESNPTWCDLFDCLGN